MGILLPSPLFLALLFPGQAGSVMDDPRLEGAATIDLIYRLLGAVVVTFVGGLFFSWLRWRTKGVHGPILTHWLISSLATTAAFIATR